MRFSFGICQLDTASREFLRRGEAVHLSPKAFDLLRLLIEQRPRVVSKAELMQALWPDTFVVEGNLPVLVAEVREALGDRAEAAKVIKTHHGIGYSFAADVEDARPRQDAVPTVTRAVLRVDTRRIALDAGQNDIGRDPECTVYINDASVSRRHAAITVVGFVASVSDLGSKNGTRVNDVPVRAATVLQDGDELTFGQVRALFVAARRRDPASTQTL